MKSFFSAAIVCLTAAQLWATPIENATSFSSGFATDLTFVNPVVAYGDWLGGNYTTVTNQFESQGVTFSTPNYPSQYPGVVLQPYQGFPNFAGNTLYNFFPNGAQLGAITINFTAPQTGAEFAAYFDNSPGAYLTATAYLNGNYVDSATGPYPGNVDGSNDIFGFINEQPFNQLVIAFHSDNNLGVISNLQFTSPEPGSLVLSSIAGVGLCWAARRRRKA